jgi:hypothetical protein
MLYGKLVGFVDIRGFRKTGGEWFFMLNRFLKLWYLPNELLHTERYVSFSFWADGGVMLNLCTDS